MALRSIKIYFFLIALASLPLFLVHLAAVLQKEHLQFVVLLPILMWIVSRRNAISGLAYSEGRLWVPG